MDDVAEGCAVGVARGHEREHGRGSDLRDDYQLHQPQV